MRNVEAMWHGTVTLKHCNFAVTGAGFIIWPYFYHKILSVFIKLVLELDSVVSLSKCYAGTTNPLIQSKCFHRSAGVGFLTHECLELSSVHYAEEELQFGSHPHH